MLKIMSNQVLPEELQKQVIRKFVYSSLKV